MRNKLAIAGIHTGIGKTVVSAVLAEALGADYWKPVQAGVTERDTDLVSGLISNGISRVHPEAVVLKHPLSPHAAARLESVQIDHKTFAWPETSNRLLIETAGGLLSPISETATMADFIADHNLPLLLVSANYLGSINHTLLSLETIRARGLNLLGIIISGDSHEPSESFIEQYSGQEILARIPVLRPLNTGTVFSVASGLRPILELKLKF